MVKGRGRKAQRAVLTGYGIGRVHTRKEGFERRCEPYPESAEKECAAAAVFGFG